MFFVVDQDFEKEAQFEYLYEAYNWIQSNRFNYFSRTFQIVDEGYRPVDYQERRIAKELFGATYTGLIDFLEETYHELFGQLARKAVHDASFFNQIVNDLYIHRYNQSIDKYIIRMALDCTLTNE